MDEYQEYLRQELQLLSLDAEIYLDYLLGLLYSVAEAGGDTTAVVAFFQECNLSEEEAFNVASRIYEAYVTAWWSASQHDSLNPEAADALPDAIEDVDSAAEPLVAGDDFNSRPAPGLHAEAQAPAAVGPPPGLLPAHKDPPQEDFGTDDEPFDAAEYFVDGEDDAAAAAAGEAGDGFDLMVTVDLVEDALKAQHDWTQEFPPEVLFLALNKADCDVDATARLLMHNVDVLAQCKPCRHLLQSRCVRSDCFFDHDLSNVPCKFWLYYGSCEQSTEDCVFMHDLRDPPPPPRTVAGAAGKLAVPDASAFPSLLSATGGTMSARQRSATGFMEAINRATEARGATQREQKVRRSGYGAYGSASSLKESLFELGFISKESLREHQHHQYNVDAAAAGSVSAAAYWKSGGDTLRVAYQQLRQDAATLAKARNHYLQQATQAYLLNDRRTARQFSQQGQRHNQQMKQAHREAAIALFQLRNSNLSQLCDQGIIDLHGLHVAEAAEILADIVPVFLDHFAAAPGHTRRPIRVFTGSGHHSVVYGHFRPRLLPAVQKEVARILRDGAWPAWRQQEIRDANGFVSGVMLTR